MSRSTEKRRPGRPQKLSREKVIQLAMEAYWQEGPDALSLNEVCRRAETSKPALYREFGGEDGLTNAVLEQYRAEAVLPLLSILEADLPYRHAWGRVLDVTLAASGMPAGCLFTKMRLAATPLGPSTAETLRNLEAERRQAFAITFAQAQRKGEVVDSIPAEFAARYLDNQLTLVLLQLAQGEPPDMVRREAELALDPLFVRASDHDGQ